MTYLYTPVSKCLIVKAATLHRPCRKEGSCGYGFGPLSFTVAAHRSYDERLNQSAANFRPRNLEANDLHGHQALKRIWVALSK